MTSNIDASLEETLSYIAGQLKTLTSIASLPAIPVRRLII